MVKATPKQTRILLHPVVAEMNPHLQKLFIKMGEVWDDAAGSELLKRYELGELVNEAMSDERKYGQQVLAKLAQALDVKPDYLYRCRRLAQLWGLTELEALRERRHKNGRRIEFTHLVLISAVSSSADRDRLIEEFFEKGLTTRRLIERVKEVTGKSKRGQLARPKSPTAGLAAMQKFAADYLEKSTIWNDVVFEPIEDVISNERDTSHLEELIATKTSHQAVRQHVEANIKKLEKCIECARQAQEEKQKVKRHPKTTTPSRQRATGKPSKTQAPARRKRVVV